MLFPALFQIATPKSSDTSCSVYTSPGFACSTMLCCIVTGVLQTWRVRLKGELLPHQFPTQGNSHAAISLVRLGQIKATPPPPAQFSWRKMRWWHHTTTRVPSHVLTSSGRAEPIQLMGFCGSYIRPWSQEEKGWEFLAGRILSLFSLLR